MESPVYPPGSATHRRRGFSLVEMLVAVAIILTMTAVAVLAYGNARKDAMIGGDAEKLKSLFVEARNRAIAANQRVAVAVDIDNRVFWVDEVDAADTVTGPKVSPPEYVHPDVVIAEVKIGSQTYTDGVRRVIFEGSGAHPYAVVNFRRSFDNAADPRQYYSVQLYPAAGEPRVLANVRK